MIHDSYPPFFFLKNGKNYEKNSYLDEVGEGHADDHKFVDEFQQVRAGEHAVLETVVEEV